MLTKEKKVQIVSALSEDFSKATLITFIDFTGLNVASMAKLRSTIKSVYPGHSKVKVARNKLLELALKNAGYSTEELGNILEGPTAVVYVIDEDPVKVLKALSDFRKEHKGKPAVKGAYFEGTLIDPDKVEEYAKLPSREELYAMLLARMQSPISGLVYTLGGVLRKLLYALKAIEEKKS
ncbi:MAG TPA: 50S ribosomal protein L10 [Thermotogae bacterium]|nr:large subunit ribosomal protein [Thermotogota bacterium]HCZ05800.1 50S ribosomal protein L10 [Thermotogota bacterium]